MRKHDSLSAVYYLKEMKKCPLCHRSFEAWQSDPEFFEKLSPFDGEKQYLIPHPQACPSCRQQALLAFRNERSLYARKCDKSGANIISMYKPQAKFPIYERSLWWTDDWDPKSYGRPYDLSRSFFDQFNELLSAVPQFSIYHAGTNENCDYSNTILDNRNCYLCFSVTHSQDCLYVSMGDSSKDCVDCLYIDRSELLYECVDCERCYHSMFLERCISCHNSQFCIDCIGCSNCVGCVNLRNVTYGWFNEVLSKAEYEKRLAAISPLTRNQIEELRKKLQMHRSRFPRRGVELVETQDCSGDHVKHSRDCVECFDLHDSEDCFNICRSFGIKSSQTCYGVAGHELLFNIMSGKGNKFMGAVNSYDNSDCYYLYSCFQNSNIFGCVSLRRSEYCILNQQYSKEDYFELMGKIILNMKDDNEWGEFFPASLSPFGYNETVAYEYYPLDKEAALAQGFLWSEYEAPVPQSERVMKGDASKIISEIGDEILNQAFICEATGKLFRITRKELEFYRSMEIPLPLAHPDVRHKWRIGQRNPRFLYERECEQCKSPIQSTYAPNSNAVIYCEPCYQAEMA